MRENPTLLSSTTPKPRYKTVKFVTNPRVNSRGGCVTCKVKKVKCDEIKPSCLYCKNRGLDCKYKTSPQKAGNSLIVKYRQKHNDAKEMENKISAEMTYEAVTGEFKDIAGNHKISNFYENTEHISLLDRKLGTQSFLAPSSITFLLLKDKSFYIDFFYHQVSTLVTVSSKDRNYFQQLYSVLALEEESFTFLVAAWSSLYYKGFPYKNILEADCEVKGYLSKALNRFHKVFRAKNTALDYYFQIVFYIVMVKMFLCYGGTEFWRPYLKLIQSLVIEYGGLERFCSDLDYDRNARFAVSSIQHIDILSSKTVAEGTLFPIDEYRKVFSVLKSNNRSGPYGIDPLQGCQQTIALVMGDILNCKVLIERSQLELDLGNSDEYKFQKVKHLKFVEDIAEKLEMKLQHCNPDWYDFPKTLCDQDTIVPFQNLFKIFKLSCQIYLELYIKRITPSNYKIQRIVSEILDLFELLLPTKMCLILVLPLIACGICIFNEPDKLRLRGYADRLKKLSAIRNVEKCWLVVERAFELNPDGNTIVDWSKICEEFGWDLNIC